MMQWSTKLHYVFHTIAIHNVLGMIYNLPEEKNHARIIFFCRFLSAYHQNVCSI